MYNLPPTLPDKENIISLLKLIKPTSKHKRLLDDLINKGCLYSLRHVKSYDGLSLEGGVYDKNHILIHANARVWLKDKIATLGSPFAVWEKYKDDVLFYSEAKGSIEYFVMPTGDRPDDFLQLEIYSWDEKITHRLFETKPWSRVSDEYDLLEGCGRGIKLDAPINTENVYYEFSRMFIASELIGRYNELQSVAFKKRTNVLIQSKNKTTGEWESVPYSEAFPKANTSMSNPSRLMQDWAESSAGLSGAIFSDHWVLTGNEWTNSSGETSISIIPYWTTKKPIKEVKSNSNGYTPYQIFDMASKIDNQAGYPFAWYFYMLHGNRVKDWFGILMLKAAESGLIFMPEHDYRVLKRWNDSKYGF